MHAVDKLSPRKSAEETIAERASHLVALGFMLNHFDPFGRVEINQQDMTCNLQQYGLLIHDLSQGFFSDIERILESAPITPAKEAYCETTTR